MVNTHSGRGNANPGHDAETTPTQTQAAIPEDVPVTFRIGSPLEFKNNILMGASLGQLLTILVAHYDAVNWLYFLPRILGLVFLACINSFLALIEFLIYGRAISKARQQLPKRPLFVLGHPRTGTTHLHNLFALDPELCHANTFQCGFPNAFLFFERFSPLLSSVLSSTRPMDNVRLAFDVPQEDELAVNVLSGGISPYMPLVLMSREPRFRPYFTFEKAQASHKTRWLEAFKLFLAKLKVRFGDEKRLVLKSPVHTARVKLFLDMFPDAQFVYIHRHPLIVLKSALRMADKAYHFSALDRPTPQQVVDFVFNQYELLHREYIKAKELIPEGNLCEVRYDDLHDAPVDEMQRIYETLGMDFSRVRDAMVEYCDSLKTYKKNEHLKLHPDLVAMAQQRWANAFEDFDYDPRSTSGCS